MKKYAQLRYLALVGIAFAGSATAETFSQKTFFSPRAVGANRVMEYTSEHELIFGHFKAPSKSKILSHVALTGFYQESQKSDELGKYFGIGNGKNSFRVDQVTAPTQPMEVVNSYLIHTNGDTAATSPLAGTISFNPKQEIYGIRLDYFQDINDPFKRFFFKASMPVVHVQQDMGMKIPDGAKVNVGETDFTLQNFLAGNVSLSASKGPGNVQGPLTKAKIDGRRSTTGIADINLALGYKLHQTVKNHLFCNVGLIIPTSKNPTGEYLFEPRSGNSDHLGFTAGLEGGVELWSNKDASVRLLASLDYRYLFESTENRTPSLNESFFPAGQGKLNYYYLGSYNRTGPVTLLPAANVFTQGLKIKPGSQGEALVDLSFKCSGFVVDLGYNAFYKEKESVWIKNWDDNSFAIALRNLDTSKVINVVPSTDTAINGRDVTKADFDMESVTNPSQFSHKVFGGLGYSFTLAQKYLATLGIGASYEFATDNATMETMALWAKASISF